MRCFFIYKAVATAGTPVVCGCFYARGCLRARYQPCDDAKYAVFSFGTQKTDVRGLHFSFAGALRSRRCATVDGLYQHIKPPTAESHQRYHSCDRESHMSFLNVYRSALLMLSSPPS
jgi:hypothetical protein